MCFSFISRNQHADAHSGAANATLNRKIKVAHALPLTHPVHLGIEHFAERLEALSGGAIVCQIYPSGQLGSETEYIEKLQSGTLDIAKTSAAPLANFVPRMKVFSLPYLFRDRSHYWDVLDGEIGNELLAALATRQNNQASGFRGICYYDAGSRNFYTTTPVTKPSDLSGLNIRVMKDSVAIAMTEALSASPVPMPGGEIYSALQKGDINGAENNPPTFVAQRHFEVCKHFTFDHHSRIPDVLNISSSLWTKLSDQEKEWVRTAARESSRFQRTLWKKRSDAAVAEMQAAGVTIHRPDPITFQQALGNAMSPFLVGEVKSYAKKIQAQ
ncbi:TRAP transporter substrate-binding protein [Rubritalea tangerina]|uniref:TRAP transporter substrate-binding protein n=1 Tax=Rubritalea tangerina TaxID=430798 RepID=UPI0036186AAB